jgi:FkbM family methyltransferase
MTEETIDFGIFKLAIDNQDGGGRYYKDPKFWADLICPIQQEIIERFKPNVFLDIGANYGFTSLIHFTKNPDCSIIAVEASPILIPFLKKNLHANGCNSFTVIKAVCSDESISEATFSLNPQSSQDNRVIGTESWHQVNVDSTTIDSLLKPVTSDDFVYIKIDVQGWEERVFKGGLNYMSQTDNWIIKTEFAPYWLKSQNTDPISFLKHLVSKYVVAEMPNRRRFRGDYLKALVRSSLKQDDCLAFVDYIQSLAKRNSVDIGWCDLIVLPLPIAERL